MMVRIERGVLNAQDVISTPKFHSHGAKEKRQNQDVWRKAGIGVSNRIGRWISLLASYVTLRFE
jgi:hypothetical protein